MIEETGQQYQLPVINLSSYSIRFCSKPTCIGFLCLYKPTLLVVVVCTCMSFLGEGFYILASGITECVCVSIYTGWMTVLNCGVLCATIDQSLVSHVYLRIVHSQPEHCVLYPYLTRSHIIWIRWWSSATEVPDVNRCVCMHLYKY